MARTRPNKHRINFALSRESMRTLTELARRSSITRTAVVELLIREKGKEMSIVKVEPLTDGDPKVTEV